jgi:hypothetical protein
MDHTGPCARVPPEEPRTETVLSNDEPEVTRAAADMTPSMQQAGSAADVVPFPAERHAWLPAPRIQQRAPEVRSVQSQGPSLPSRPN